MIERAKEQLSLIDYYLSNLNQSLSVINALTAGVIENKAALQLTLPLAVHELDRELLKSLTFLEQKMIEVENTLNQTERRVGEINQVS